MMFPAFLILRRRQPAHPRPYRMPGGSLGAWVAVVVCWVIVATNCLLFFKPAPNAQNAALETCLLAAETLITLVAGLALIPRPKAGPPTLEPAARSAVSSAHLDSGTRRS